MRCDYGLSGCDQTEFVKLKVLGMCELCNYLLWEIYRGFCHVDSNCVLCVIRINGVVSKWRWRV